MILGDRGSSGVVMEEVRCQWVRECVCEREREGGREGGNEGGNKEGKKTEPAEDLDKKW